MEQQIQYAETEGVGKVPGRPAFEEDNLARARTELKKEGGHCNDRCI